MGHAASSSATAIAAAASTFATLGAADEASVVASISSGSGNPEWAFPLLLSCMAGASTCLGAAVVFCFPSHQIKRSMSFSLSLAASVMVTVSAISIGPECWEGIVVTVVGSVPTVATMMTGGDATSAITGTAAAAASGGVGGVVVIHWWLLFERIASFGAGCGGYFLLSRLLGALPEPEMLFFLRENIKIDHDYGDGGKELSASLLPSHGEVEASNDIDGSGAVAVVALGSAEDGRARHYMLNRSSSLGSSANACPEEDGSMDGRSKTDATPSPLDLPFEDAASPTSGSATIRGSYGNEKKKTAAVEVETRIITRECPAGVPSSSTMESAATPRTKNGLHRNRLHHQQDQRQRRKTKASAVVSSLAAAYPAPPTLERASSYDSAVSAWDGDDGGGNNRESTSDIVDAAAAKQRSWRVAMLLFVSLLCHNFPEGLCVAASAQESPQLGITVAIGIFIHNVPEGIAIAVPCIAARPDKPWLAFWLASVSGLAEPAGAIVALSVLHHTRLPLENVLASVAGVMCMVAVMELYPEAVRSLPSSSVLLLQQQQPDKPKRGLGTVLRSYRPILWGTLVGMAMMVTTEWYL